MLCALDADGSSAFLFFLSFSLSLMDTVLPLMEDRVQSVKRIFDEGSSTESTRHSGTISLEQKMRASSSPFKTFPPDDIKNRDDDTRSV